MMSAAFFKDTWRTTFKQLAISVHHKQVCLIIIHKSLFLSLFMSLFLSQNTKFSFQHHPNILFDYICYSDKRLYQEMNKFETCIILPMVRLWRGSSIIKTYYITFKKKFILNGFEQEVELYLNPIIEYITEQNSHHDLDMRLHYHEQ